MRIIPTDLKAHLNGNPTTTCRLIKISLTNGTIYGICSLDRDIIYDDGTADGAITYVAANGFDPSTMSSDVGYSVPNAEAYALISDDIPGVTVEMANAGDLDDAQWVAYLVNYEDLSMGHIALDAGDIGEVRVQQGLIWTPELLSYITRTRQPIGTTWSVKCRAIFGTPAASQTGCGIDASGLWVDGTVTEVGGETDRVFSGDNIIGDNDIAPYPGRVLWVTGDNVGRDFAVEALESDNGVTLVETTPRPIQVGDTYRIRPDCGKRYKEDCIDIWHNGPNFKGEPLIPTGDSSAIQAPGAQLPAAGGFRGSPAFTGGE